MIAHYAVNVPISDQYALVPMFQSLDHKQIPWGAMWAQHNEHRIFFPTMILLILAEITHWNTVSELYASFIIACVGLIGLYRILSRSINNQWAKIFTTILVSVIFFLPAQGENWLWGWQLEWFLCVAAIIWAIDLLDLLDPEASQNRLYFPMAIAIIASFSLANGLLVWVAGAAILLIRKFRISQISLWILGAILSTIFYYYHYTFLDSNSLRSITPLNFLKEYLSYIGRPISSNSHVALYSGVVIIVLFFATCLATILRRQLKKMVTVMSLGLVAVITGFLIAGARSTFGVAGALSSVHTTFAILLLISLVILLANLATSFMKPHFFKWQPLTLMAILISPGLIYIWVNGMGAMRTQHALDAYVYACSHDANPNQFCLTEIYFVNTKNASEWLNYLKSKHYAGY